MRRPRSPRRRARGELRTRRWNDPAHPGDGLRILVCRYRPRGLRRGDETWDEWWQSLAPSRELHAAVYGKGQPAIGFAELRRRFLVEMRSPEARESLRRLREKLAGGETVTLLCSSACEDEGACHRSILRALLTPRSGRAGGGAGPE